MHAHWLADSPARHFFRPLQAAVLHCYYFHAFVAYVDKFFDCFELCRVLSPKLLSVPERHERLLSPSPYPLCLLLLSLSFSLLFVVIILVFVCPKFISCKYFVSFSVEKVNLFHVLWSRAYAAAGWLTELTDLTGRPAGLHTFLVWGESCSFSC